MHWQYWRASAISHQFVESKMFRREKNLKDNWWVLLLGVSFIVGGLHFLSDKKIVIQQLGDKGNNSPSSGFINQHSLGILQRKRSQRQFYVLESFSEAYSRQSDNLNDYSWTKELERMGLYRQDICLQKANSITQDFLNEILSKGGEVVSQGDTIPIATFATNLYDTDIFVKCNYTLYVVTYSQNPVSDAS